MSIARDLENLDRTSHKVEHQVTEESHNDFMAKYAYRSQQQTASQRDISTPTGALKSRFAQQLVTKE